MSDKVVKKTMHPSEGVTVNLAISVIDGEPLDTEVKLSGAFCVSGASHGEFIKKLGDLIDEYRI